MINFINGITDMKNDIRVINTIACSIAHGGAEGVAGSVIILAEDGSLRRFNLFDLGYTLHGFTEFLKSLNLKSAQYLGMGNVLYIREEDAEWLLYKRDRYMETSEEPFAAFQTATLYKKWIDFCKEHLETLENH